MKIVAIIQARMGSSRLPGKMLMKLAGKPVVKQVYERAMAIEGVDNVLIATTTDKKDDPLVAYCVEAGIPVLRGSPDDVLDRYYQAAKGIGADVIMRITGDCPFLDPVESGRVLKLFLEDGQCDYCSNVEPPFLPDGLDTEVISFKALENVWRTAKDIPYREHVTLFIRRNPDLFSVRSLKGDVDLGSHRWTLDEQRDYDFLNAVALRLNQREKFGYHSEILELLRDEPALVEINNNIKRNERLEKSLKEHSLTS